jgi:hypothetical protein
MHLSNLGSAANHVIETVRDEMRPSPSAHSSKAVTGPRVVPTPQRHQRPYGLDQPERPCALEEPIEGPERARSREREDKPRAALFQGVADEHRRDRE